MTARYPIERSVPWRDHHPETVHTFAQSSEKTSDDKILDIEGHAGKFSPREAYDLAKHHGDHAAAYSYVEHLFNSNPQALQKLIEKHARQNPLIVPVVGLEHMENGVYKHNAIPDVFAVFLSDRTGWPVHGEGTANKIIQSNKAGRTGSRKIDRMVRQPTFEGGVAPGRNYILVDDHVSNGGTLRNLLDFIESKGGRAVGASTLTRGSRDASFRPLPRTVSRIRNTVGENNFNALHRKMFGKSPENMLFTAGELSNIRVIYETEFLPIHRARCELGNKVRIDQGKKPLPILEEGKSVQDKFFKHLVSEINHALETRTSFTQTNAQENRREEGHAPDGQRARGAERVQRQLDGVHAVENSAQTSPSRSPLLTPKRSDYSPLKGAHGKSPKAPSARRKHKPKDYKI